MYKRSRRNLSTFLVVLLIIVTIILPSFSFPRSTFAHADPPKLWLPTPVGETWEVIQGFYCGTHDNEREIDFSRSNGSTIGVPVRAAADGTVHFWTASSGTLIIDHGNDYYTEYTHLSDAFSTVPGTPVVQGQDVGHVNDYDHLHFSFYHSPSGSYFNRTTLELDFLDGYSLHDTSGCNQHFGETIVAKDNPDTSPPTIAFAPELETDQWYCKDQRIEFTIDDDRQIRGFSQKFNGEPEDKQPEFTSDAGYVQLAWAKEGMHTLVIRAWDGSDNVSTASFGPIGYDATPPTVDTPHTTPEHIYRAGTFTLSWNEANDGDGSGIAGYTYYLGTDPNGTSDKFTENNSVEVPDVAPGCYVLRIQAHDNACGTSDWVTIQNVVVNDRKGSMPAGACESETGSTSEATTNQHHDTDDKQSEAQDTDDDTNDDTDDDTLPLTNGGKDEIEEEQTEKDQSDADSDASQSTERKVNETEADEADETNVLGEVAKTDTAKTNDAEVGDTVAEDTVAEDTVAEDTVAEDTVAEDTVAEDTIAEDTVAEDTVAEDTVAEDTVAEDTTLDETQVAESESQETASTSATTQASPEIEEETPPTESPDISVSEQVPSTLPLSTQDLPQQADVQVIRTP